MEDIYVIQSKNISIEMYKFDFGIMTILINYLNECYNKYLMDLKLLDIKLSTIELEKSKCKVELEKIELEKIQSQNNFELESQKNNIELEKIKSQNNLGDQKILNLQIKLKKMEKS
jgi:hypothetical protein